MSTHIIHGPFGFLALILDASPLSLQTMLGAGISKFGIPFVNGREEAGSVDIGKLDCLVFPEIFGTLVKVSKSGPEGSIVIASGRFGKLNSHPDKVDCSCVFV